MTIRKKGKKKPQSMKKKIRKHVWTGRILSAAVTAALLLTAVPVPSVLTAQAEDVAAEAEDLTTLVDPVLQQYERASVDGVWKVAADTRFVLEATEENIQNERLQEVIELMDAEFCEKKIPSGTPLAMTYILKGENKASDILVNLVEANEIGTGITSEEAYRIEIGANGVVIKAASENAVIYALRTIQALSITCPEGLPYGVIIDYPDVAERRLHVDCGRKYFSKDWFIRQIRELSYLKINTLQMHFAENQGFRIECQTDPDIVSEQYLTKKEVREILEEARKYGIKVIPSFDSPGHVDQILKVHPEYGQLSSTGEHYASGLDVTNEEAVAYMRSLYQEYMDLFGDYCTDFHIGGDEYMQFDRAPFTSEYQSILTQYAVDRWGSGYTWKDTLANYINELAEFLHDAGFKPRVFNDGLYYGESYAPQKIVMHDYIGIDFWSQMSWDRSVAKLPVFVQKGHKDIYNFNASFFYYVLRGEKPTDGREQHSFDVLDQDKNIYENWMPGKFQENTVEDDAEYIKGVAMGVWCDYPDITTEDVITEDIASELRAMACRAWNVDSRDRLPWSGFSELCDTLGHPAAYAKGSSLPEVGHFEKADDMGKITVHYVDDAQKALKEDLILYGEQGKEFSVEADEIYGYRLKGESSFSGTFQKADQEFTFRYEKYCDKSALKAALDNKRQEAASVRETYTAYQAAYKAAEAVYQDEDSGQKEVDDALAALKEATKKVVRLSSSAAYSLYVETAYMLSEEDHIAGYEAYAQAVAHGKELLESGTLDERQLKAALEAIREAKKSLRRPDGALPRISSTKPGCTDQGKEYKLDYMLDNDLDTKAWFNGNQTVGDEIVFTFDDPVMMSSIRVVQPQDVGADKLANASVQTAGTDGVYTTVGTLTTDGELDETFSFDKKEVKYVRILLNEGKEKWYQISEVSFVYEQRQEDNSLRNLIVQAEDMVSFGKEKNAISDMVDALIAAQKVYTSGNGNAQDAEQALRAAMDALKKAPDEKLPYTDVVEGVWPYDYARDLYLKEIMTGMQPTVFGPATKLARAQFAVILYRMEGSPDVQYDDRFPDVQSGQFYSEAVIWAAEHKIVNGYSDSGRFGPGDQITRDQMATMMYRYAQYKEYDLTSQAELESYPDHLSVEVFALDGMKWCVGKGIINGDNGKLNPLGSTNRAECATIVSRFIEKGPSEG